MIWLEKLARNISTSFFFFLFFHTENSEMFPASGGARVGFRTTKAIRFAKHGCTNRPFYHIVVMEVRSVLHFLKSYCIKQLLFFIWFLFLAFAYSTGSTSFWFCLVGLTFYTNIRKHQYVNIKRASGALEWWRKCFSTLIIWSKKW